MLEIPEAMAANEKKLNGLIGLQEPDDENRSENKKGEAKFNSPKANSNQAKNETSASFGFGPITHLFQTFENTMTKLRKNTDVLIDQKITQDKELTKQKDTISQLK